MSRECIVESTSQIDAEILSTLSRQEPWASSTFSVLVKALPDYTWNQVFLAVDRLSREGRVRLTRDGRFEYRISMVSDGGR